MDTVIFESYDAFLNRKDKTANGVSTQFANKHPNWKEMNETNQGCWNCAECEDCLFCVECEECVECSFCWGCVELQYMNCKQMNNKEREVWKIISKLDKEYFILRKSQKNDDEKFTFSLVFGLSIGYFVFVMVLDYLLGNVITSNIKFYLIAGWCLIFAGLMLSGLKIKEVIFKGKEMEQKQKIRRVQKGVLERLLDDIEE